MWRGWLGAVLVAELVAGCGKTAAHGSGANDSASDPAADAEQMAAWVQARTEAECEQDATCFDGAVKRYSSEAECVEDSLARYIELNAYYRGIDVFVELASVYRAPSADARAACLRWLAECGSASTGPCKDVLQPRSTVPRGGACGSRDFHEAPPCAQGLSCVYDECLTCQPWAEEGQDCGHLDCAPPLFCHQTSFLMGDVAMSGPQYCVRKSQLGEACRDQVCADGLVCFEDVCRTPGDIGEACRASTCKPPLQCTLNVCQAPPAILGEGEPCGEGPRSCALELRCIQGRCQARGTDGATCSRAVPPAAPRCRHWCVFDAPDAVEGHCRDTPPSLEPPVPCSLFRDELQLACPFGTHADMQGEEPRYPDLAAFCNCLPGPEPKEPDSQCF
jgi:hypothetical protein